MAAVKIKRVYYAPEKSDGFRVLVDRLWPRGIKKEDAHVDLWMKVIAPSDGLRKWFDHDPAKWEEFKNRYETELQQSNALEELLSYIDKHKTVTLIYGAKDEQHNQAVVLKDLLVKNKNTKETD